MEYLRRQPPTHFEEIPELGNTGEPEVLYKKSRGRDASVEALLERSEVK